jgi:hypothetical protein
MPHKFMRNPSIGYKAHGSNPMLNHGTVAMAKKHASEFFG